MLHERVDTWVLLDSSSRLRGCSLSGILHRRHSYTECELYGAVHANLTPKNSSWIKSTRISTVVLYVHHDLLYILYMHITDPWEATWSSFLMQGLMKGLMIVQSRITQCWHQFGCLTFELNHWHDVAFLALLEVLDCVLLLNKVATERKARSTGGFEMSWAI